MRNRAWPFVLITAAPLLAVGSYSCGSSDSAESAGAGEGCETDADCASAVCEAGACVGNDPGGLNRPSGANCDDDEQCASGACTDGLCHTGTALDNGQACSSAAECESAHCEGGLCADVSETDPDASVTPNNAGSPCTTGGECSSGVCVDGVCQAGTGGGVPTTTTTGPHYDGSGTGYRPLTTGCGPDTADQCTGTCEQSGGQDSQVLRAPATLCFGSPEDPTPDDPSVVIEQVIETIDGVTYVHLRVTFDPAFVDNTYGESSEGWSPVRGHRFSDLIGSDHTELRLTNGTGDTVMNFKVDLIEEDPSSRCGYGSLGVSGGDGDMLLGDAACIMGTATSLDRNLNHCGFDTCYTEHSPTEEQAPEWDKRLVYEVWVDASCFGSEGFGQGFITYVHASPAKGEQETLTVEPEPCPPDWDEPYCPPSIIEEGGNCFGTTPPDGNGGSGGAPPDGSTESCPPNYTAYITSEGDSLCTPIPYANYPNKEACPEGYYLYTDITTESQYCLADGTNP